MLRSHHVMRSSVINAQKRFVRKLSDSAPKQINTPPNKSSPPPGGGGKGGIGGLIAVPFLLVGATLGGGAYAVEHNASLEDMIKKYEIPFILEVMAPVREGIRFAGFGHPSQEATQEEVKVAVEEKQEQKDTDPYSLEEDQHKDLHEEALEELAEELMEEVGENQGEEAETVMGETESNLESEADMHDEGKAEEVLSDDEEEQENAATEGVEEVASAQEEEGSQEEEVIEKEAEIVQEVAPSSETASAHAEAIPQVPSGRSKLLEVRENALEEVLGSIAKQTNDLRAETERNLVHDLDGLDENALRYRIAQLTTEFFERIKWEGLRQQQALQQAESVLSQKYSDLLTQQENELKLDSERRLFELEKNLRQESSNAVQGMQVAQETRVHEALTKQERELSAQFETSLEQQKASLSQSLEEQHTLEIAMTKEAQVKQMLETQKEVKAVSQEISALNKVVETEFSKTSLSASTHALSAAVLMAEDALVTAAPAGKAIEALKKFSSSEPLVAAVVQTLPVTAARKGVPVMDDIKLRFSVVREEARKAALAPEGTNPIISQMIGTILSVVAIKPSGNIEGDSVEAALSRIEYYLDKNKLDLALRETKTINGYPRTLMTDWERMVNDRLVVDQAIRSLKTVSALRHLELS